MHTYTLFDTLRDMHAVNCDFLGHYWVQILGGKILKTKKVLHTCLYTVKNKNIVCDVFPELEGGGGGGGVGRRGGLPLMCTSWEL
jgi:hypothetical protein